MGRAVMAAMVAALAGPAWGQAGLLTGGAEELAPITLASGRPLAEAPYELATGRYYALPIRADGSAELAIGGADFFRNVWVDEIIVADIELRPMGIESLEFDAEGEAVIRFVTIRPGTFFLRIPGTTGEAQMATFDVTDPDGFRATAPGGGRGRELSAVAAHPGLVAAALATALLAGPLGAQPAQDPDWPCVQRKVPSLTPATIWTGPGIEGAAPDWADDAEVAEFVARLVQRRLPIEEAEAEVAAFAEELDPGERRERLTRLFAGLFETMNGERGEIMAGIDRYARHQRTMAQEIRAEAAQVDQARAAPEPDAQAVAEAEADLAGRIRVFDERRASLPFVCEAPRLVEQRLFALGRAISGAMEG